jgi:glycosyltransferase involved in cell wall biosynthesis
MGSPPGLEERGVQWIPDFQEHRFPDFFDPAERRSRQRRNADWFAKHQHVMVSSEDVAADLRRFYPKTSARVHVLRFASFTPPAPGDEEVMALRQQYGLPERYYICSNQFWRHKNHEVVLKALARTGPRTPPVAFTGREDDHRDPGYAPWVRALASALGLGDRARFLGFLPRSDQLGLMSGAIAVVQPSLCEGWSTVIEDAKALGRPVLASDIAVHREQLGAQGPLFEPDDEVALADLMTRFAHADPPSPGLDYSAARCRFADDLRGMVDEVTRDFRRRRVDRLIVKA